MAKRVLVFILLFFLMTNTGWSQYENKRIPEEVREAAIQALEYFPELEGHRIIFKFRKQLKGRVMQAQPRISSLFRNRDKRAYKITMSKNLTMKDTLMTIDQLPQEILAGWFAHELGHIMDYKDRSSAEMVKFGFNYLTSKTFLKRSERNADMHAARHGMAKHLIKTKRFILFKSKFKKDYKDKIERLYPSPEEIMALGETEE